MFGKKPRITLYKRVSLLVMFAVVVSLLTEYGLIFTVTDNMREQRRQDSAFVTASTLAELPNLKEAIIHGIFNNEMESMISSIGKATHSNIIIFDRKKTPVFVRMEAPTDTFIKEAEDLAFSENADFIELSSTRLKDYYYDRVSQQVFDEEDNLIGAVVVAELVSDFEVKQSKENLLLIFLANFVGLIVGILGCAFVVSSIKETLFGLEPEEISKLLEERSEMINSVQEGVLCVDKEGFITLINSSARHIFEYAGLRPQNPLGEHISKVYMTDMKEVLEDGIPQINQEEKINNVTVLTNQVPIKLHDDIVGAITTFRMKTEMEALAQQLTGVKTYADALRAQTHEFMNKMHVILGLLKMENYVDLKDYVKSVASAREDETRYITQRLKDPILSGFILGKVSRARELDIEFSLTEESNIPDQIAPAYMDKIIIIVGNLINNAFEEVSHIYDERIVLLTMVVLEGDLFIVVEDSGNGITEENIQKIFKKGFSLKGDNRGIGLHLVKQTLDEFGGSIEVESKEDEGTVFTVSMPYMKK